MPLLESPDGTFPPESACASYRIHWHAFYVVQFCILCILLVFHKFLEANRCFTLKIDSDVYDSEIRDDFIGPN